MYGLGNQIINVTVDRTKLVSSIECYYYHLQSPCCLRAYMRQTAKKICKQQQQYWVLGQGWHVSRFITHVDSTERNCHTCIQAAASCQWIYFWMSTKMLFYIHIDNSLDFASDSDNDCEFFDHKYWNRKIMICNILINFWSTLIPNEKCVLR